MCEWREWEEWRRGNEKREMQERREWDEWRAWRAWYKGDGTYAEGDDSQLEETTLEDSWVVYVKGFENQSWPYEVDEFMTAAGLQGAIENRQGVPPDCYWLKSPSGHYLSPEDTLGGTRPGDNLWMISKGRGGAHGWSDSEAGDSDHHPGESSSNQLSL